MPVSATKALARAAESGERLTLPQSMSSVEQRGGILRRGHLVMLAGIPNSGKSAFAEWLPAKVSRPGLYFSADQDAWTSTTRLVSVLTGEATGTVADAFASGNGAYYEGALAHSPLEFCFDSNPSLEDIAAEVDAWVDTWDEYPEVIVVDTLLNIEGSGEKADDQFILSELHGLARRTKACVIVLVHASEANIKDPYRPPPRKALINKVSALPDLILTVAYDPFELKFWVAVVKTREGRADADASHPLSMPADFDRMSFGQRSFMDAWQQDWED